MTVLYYILQQYTQYSHTYTESDTYRPYTCIRYSTRSERDAGFIVVYFFANKIWTIIVQSTTITWYMNFRMHRTQRCCTPIWHRCNCQRHDSYCAYAPVLVCYCLNYTAGLLLFTASHGVVTRLDAYWITSEDANWTQHSLPLQLWPEEEQRLDDWTRGLNAGSLSWSIEQLQRARTISCKEMLRNHVISFKRVWHSWKLEHRNHRRWSGHHCRKHGKVTAYQFQRRYD